MPQDMLKVLQRGKHMNAYMQTLHGNASGTKQSSIVIIVEVLHNSGDNIATHKFAFLFLEC